LLAFDPLSQVFLPNFGVVDIDPFFGLPATLILMVSPLFAQKLAGTALTAARDGVIVI